MKYRNGFVTNSSSSSFVIAIKDGALVGQIEEELYKLISDEEYQKWVENSEWITDTKEDIYNNAASRLKRVSEYGLTIGGYNVGAIEWADDCGEDDVEFLMNFCPKGEIVKMARGY